MTLEAVLLLCGVVVVLFLSLLLSYRPCACTCMLLVNDVISHVTREAYTQRVALLSAGDLLLSRVLDNLGADVVVQILERYSTFKNLYDGKVGEEYE